MPGWLAVALGGGIGATARYLLSVGLQAALGPLLPYGTFAANVVGSFLLGVVMIALEGHQSFGVELRLALGTGVLGGFTTYSSFNYETLRMMEEGAYFRAGAYVAATVLVCAAAGAAGLAVGRAVR